ncbi:response regulator transcription factor [Nocardioides KLBMP 9356]|uniref:Response regulator transcription factor n=1 Tax=Nocardioides potassii TaxID=2911371 RepID=A0ABS9HGM2_9ACTN|nr:response regulator transcription factor [Nocardioides potassii]MCF6379281.1 response regulator transcription factor [Nocardioides potassii]
MALALVVEDDRPTLTMFAELLPSLGHTVLLAATGRECLELAASGKPDVILLDLGLPDMPGTTVIGRLREWTDMPIIVVSGSKQVRRKADALDAGADDFIDKPFDVSELRARLDVVQRRLDASQERSTARVFDGLSVDYTRRQVHRDGEEVRLTETEWLILEGLSRDAGRIVTHRWLSSRVWGPHAGSETHQTLRVHVKSLRAKLGDDAREPRYIRTETGLGYRWLSTPSAPAAPAAPVVASEDDDLARQLDALRDSVRRLGKEGAADPETARTTDRVTALLDEAAVELERLRPPAGRHSETERP